MSSVAYPTYEPKAFYATLFTDNVGVSGLALRTAYGVVLFRTEATGLWKELTEADAPNLHLHGLTAMVDAQAIADGDLARKASRTLQRA
jgi:hypothetical protein